MAEEGRGREFHAIGQAREEFALGMRKREGEESILAVEVER